MFVWDMPDVEEWKQKIIAISGFGTQFLAVPIFYAWDGLYGIVYALSAALRFCIYPWCMSARHNDFRWLIERKGWDR